VMWRGSAGVGGGGGDRHGLEAPTAVTGVVFLSAARKMPAHFKLCHTYLLVHPVPFITHCISRHLAWRNVS